MTDLKSKLTRLAEFDENRADEVCIATMETPGPTDRQFYCDGARYESHRLQPLLAALIDLADKVQNLQSAGVGLGHVYVAADRLTALAQGEEWND